MMSYKTYYIVCLFWRQLQLTLNSQKTPVQGVCIWPSGFLHLAPFFSPCIQCWHVRNTVIFYIKNGYCHTPIRLPCNQWTVQTPSLGVREPRCTVPVVVGCFYPDIQGAQLRSSSRRIWPVQWSKHHELCSVHCLCRPLYERTVDKMGSRGVGETGWL